MPHRAGGIIPGNHLLTMAEVDGDSKRADDHRACRPTAENCQVYNWLVEQRV